MAGATPPVRLEPCPRMSRFKEKYGPWALVTGASSGIGEQFARQLADRGLNLMLVARREERLRALAEELRARAGIEARVASVDLGTEDFLTEVERATEGLEIGLLVNNAGFAVTGDFLDNDIGAEEQMLQVNCRAPLLLAHAYGRPMRARGRGGMIFLGSAVGFTAVPTWSHYAATKSYDMLVAEGISNELRKAGVDVLALCPGTTRTGFQEESGTSDLLALEPKDVVRVGLRSLGRRTTVVPGLVNKLNVLSTRLLPRALNRIAFGGVVRYMTDPG